MHEHFVLDPGAVHFNHGAFGACSKPAFDAYQSWQRRLESNPTAFLTRESPGLLKSAHEALAQELRVDAEELAFVVNATHAVNAVARSIPLRPGDEVLSTNLEYGACDVVWQQVCHERGAVYRKLEVPLPFQPDEFAARWMAALSERTRLVFLSHITSATALVLPVGDLVAAARTCGVLSFIDGAHAPGQIDLDLCSIGADFYVGVAHKWLCAPKGSGFLHVRREHHGWIKGPVSSWGEHPDADTSEALQAITGQSGLQRRFLWQGTRDIAAFLAIPTAIDFQRKHEWPSWRARCHALLTELSLRHRGRNGLQALAPLECMGQMVSLPVRTHDAVALQRWLQETFRIESAATWHAGQPLLRISIQAYNTEAELDLLNRALSEARV